ncbi:hypothetical protein G3T36_13390 [Diaminobutyricibacter tongyongensis]|uniref:Integral membrane protein n=1 Tax=Leifsonia tongyongensis TaxID=1268043 RepID=A0A6L9XZW0_9MICO|nr:hypothetical protein [Diaminobutyricibacter tongyongensis]
MPGSPAPSPSTDAVEVAREAPAGTAVSRWRRSPWWLSVILIFVASRIVTTVMLLVLASVQGPNPWTGAHPGYFDFAAIWDGRWYNIVSIAGYPSSLPLLDGHVNQNAWAFMPGYPSVVDIVAFVTRAPWPVAAVIASTAFGLGAALVFYRLLRLRLLPSTSLYAVVLFCVAPVSPLFQLAYAESMYIFLLALALYLLMLRRYWWLIPVVTVMAFTRPSGLAFALALGMHVVYRFAVRARDPFPAADRVASIAVTIYSGLAGLAWPATAAIVTGSITAYTDTELSWRAQYIGFTHLVPFTPWFEGADWWFSFALGLPAWLGTVTVVLLIELYVVLLFTPAVKRLGVDLRFWLAAYGLYLLAVFFPQSSTFRLLMPIFPLLGVLAMPRSKVYRIALVIVFLALQWGWLLICWGVDGLDWTPP